MAHFISNQFSSNKGFTHSYSGGVQDELLTEATKILLSSGYTKTGESHVFEKGNRTMRILLGAFVKYYKFMIVLEEKEDNTLEMGLKSESTGMSGGLIGVNQVKKELDKLAALFQGI